VVVFRLNGAFTGSLNIINSANGISFPNNISGIGGVSKGILNLNIAVADTAQANFNITFLVLNINQPCAVQFDSTSISMSHTHLRLPNDECSGATPLSVAINSCQYVNFPTDKSSSSGNSTLCGGDGYNDLWYSFVATIDSIILEFPWNL